ncbi:hypothetical protein [Pseudactinotalea sp. Z1748]|uniref:hypothetical protein n=1 Tax=Pseudactinotalea sp. Z1748 TaxID=3413027 RepID=UPI003C7BAE92
MSSGPGTPEEDDDAVLDRLRRADPARSVTPDLTALRAAVDHRIASDAPDHEADDDAPHRATAASRAEADDDDTAAVPTWARRSGWVVAASVATLLAVGVGGYVIGSQRSETPIVLTEGADHAESAAEEPFAVQRDEAADAEEDAGVMAEEDGLMPADDVEPESGVGPARVPVPLDFIEDGLPTEPGEAEAWMLDAAAVQPEETLADTAQALALSGTPEQVDGEWHLRDADVGLALRSDGAATLRYWNASARVACATTQGEGRISEDITADHECPGTEADPPQDPEGTAAEFLDTIGVDTGRLDLLAEDPRLAMVTVQAVPASMSEAPGAAWSVVVSQHGVVSAQGGLAEPVSLGTYTTISAANAVERLSDLRFTSHLWPRFDEHARGHWDQSGTPAPPLTPEPGQPLRWPISQTRIVDADQGLRAYTHPEAGTLILPTWNLIDETGNIWPVPAVQEEFLDMAAH